MQPNYRDTVALKRQQAAQTAKEQSELGAMLAELKKMQMASLMGSQGKSTVILTDQTDLGDKIHELTERLTTAVKDTDTTTTSKEQVAALKEVLGGVKALKQAIDITRSAANSDSSEIIAALKALKLSTVVNVPDQKAPTVTVRERAIDFGPVIAAIRETRTDDEVSATSADLDCYRAQDITDSGNTQYIGFVNPSGDWYIIENDITGNKMRYVFGSGNYAQAFSQAPQWDYKLLNEAYSATV